MANVPSHSRSRRTHRRTMAAGNVNSRPTHGLDSYLPPISGAEEVYDQGVIDGGTDPVVYPPNSIPPGSVDHTPPGIPTGLVLTSDLATQPDGSKALRLIATLVQPTDSDLFASYVEVTPDVVDDVPVWLNSSTILIGNESTSGAIVGARGKTTYFGRAYAVDTFGNRSGYTAEVSVVTLGDTDAPTVPVNLAVVAGFRGMGVTWDAVAASDLSNYEVRYAPDDGSGTGPNTLLWVTIPLRTTTVWITGLTVGTKYWAQVRSIDFSGNTRTSVSDPAAVIAADFPEAGWTALASATPTNIGAADIAANSIVSGHIDTAGLDADVIKTGLLKIGTTDGFVDGLEVWYNGKRVGKWDETGFYIGKNADGLPADLSASDYVRITDAGLTVYLDGVSQSAITPDGINASALTFGTMPGGHNLLLNSGFELADFAAAPSTYDWNTNTEWNATREGSDTNVTTNAGNLTMTGSTY